MLFRHDAIYVLNLARSAIRDGVMYDGELSVGCPTDASNRRCSSDLVWPESLRCGKGSFRTETSSWEVSNSIPLPVDVR